MKPIPKLFALFVFFVASAWSQQTTVLYDAGTNVLKRPTAAQLISANGLAPATTGSFLLTGNGTGGFTNTDLTYSGSTLTTGTSGLTIAAGGSNKDITLTPSDSVQPVAFKIVPASAIPFGGPGALISHENASSGVSPSMGIAVYRNSFGSQPFFNVGAANGTIASPATASPSGTIGGFRMYSYGNSAWRTSAGFTGSTSSTFSNSDLSGVGLFQAADSTGGLLAILQVYGKTNNTVVGASAGVTNDSGFGLLQIHGNNKTISAWGANGANLEVKARTITASSSSGTVATAVANSFAVPTFAADGATTFTDFANGYWAGAPQRGPNVTGGNPWVAWFDDTGTGGGNVRMDGSLYFGGISGSVMGGLTAFTLTGGAGNMTITAGTGASRTMTLQSTTSGSTATTFLAGNAAQAVHLGGQSALATNATDGFVYIRGGAGTPTGAPSAVTGLVPLYVDTTNNKLYFYTNGAWRDAGP